MCSRTHHYISGGGSRVFIACKFLFSSATKQYFLAMNVRQFCFCFVKDMKFLFFCRMPSLLCTLLFGDFSGQHIIHKFRQQIFFSANIFNKLFSLTFVASIFFSFFSTPPPSADIRWCIPYNLFFCSGRPTNRHALSRQRIYLYTFYLAICDFHSFF